MTLEISKTLGESVMQYQGTNSFTTDKVPEQNLDYLGYIVQLSTRISSVGSVRERRFIYHGATNSFDRNLSCPWYLIVRADKVAPYCLILMNSAGRFYTTTMSIFDGLVDIDGVPPFTAEATPAAFRNNPILRLPTTDNKDWFRLRLAVEDCIAISIDDSGYLGVKVDVEYPAELSLSPDTEYLLDSNFADIPEYSYYNHPSRHRIDKRDNPRRATARGVIVSAPVPYDISRTIIMITDDQYDINKNQIFFVRANEIRAFFDSNRIVQIESSPVLPIIRDISAMIMDAANTRFNTNPIIEDPDAPTEPEVFPDQEAEINIYLTIETDDDSVEERTSLRKDLNMYLTIETNDNI